MKESIPYFLFIVLLSSCAPTETPNETVEFDSIPAIDSTLTEINPICLMHQDIDTFYMGDMNADGIPDTAIAHSPVHAYPSTEDFSGGGCEDEFCLTTVEFSFSGYLLEHDRALGFQTFFATEDLDADGIKEVAFIPNWFHSCWQGLFVYSLKDTSWNLAGSASVFACADEDFTERVHKIDRKSFEIIGVDWNEDMSEMIDTALIYRW